MPPIRHGRGRRTQSSPSSPSSSSPPSSPSLPQLSLWLQFVQLTITPAQVAVAPSSSTFRKALRPGFGTRGSKYRIYLNHFPVALGNKDPHQYDVTISPEVTSKTKNRDIMRHLTKSFADDLGNLILAYDGKKSAFAAGPLPFESKEFPVMIPEQDGMNREFKVSIKFAAKKDLNHLRLFLCGLQQDNPQETIQALDVVLRDSVSINREIIGRSLFSPGFGRGPLGDGIEFWKGFYQSLRPTQMGLSLNIDLSARAFYEETLVSDFVGKFLGRDISSPLSNEECIKVKRALRGVRVEVVHPKCCMVCYKVQAVTVQSTSELNFEDGIGAKKTVVQYFMEKYNVQLQYPHLPAIQAGNDVKPIYLPMEICRIAKGQKYGLKLNEGQVTKFLTATCQRPSARQRGIRDVQILTSKESNSLVTDQFGMHVSQLLSSIDARVLPPPPLSYKKSGCIYEVKPSVGQWNMVGLKMFKGAKLRDWAIINFSRQSKQAVGRFIYGLVSVCQSKGIDIYSWPMKDMYSAKPDSIEDALKKIRFECLALLQMLFVILPEDKGAYPRIKRVCEIDLGIVSQCFKPQHVMQMSNQYFENVAMKINVKVGGTNTVLSATLNDGLPCVTDQPTIIFGADVTHPSPGDDSSPSIAGVVASMDWPHVARYRALVSAQPHRQEIISDLYTTSTDPKGGLIHGGLIRELLFLFYLSTGHKPCRIIFYRDGVSEGQFSEVLLNEMVMIRKACLSLQEDYMPPVTFIVVQKRHHTRFFPVNYNDRAGADKSGNILPGTVVDTKICHPTEFDFYLCSHAGIQGTSRPTHYHVLFDENKFTADELQWLTNSLCYTYQRCTRSVSVVPPVYYAHLAAFRARSYMEGDLSDSDSSSSDRICVTRDRVAAVRPLRVIHENLKGVMYYC